MGLESKAETGTKGTEVIQHQPMALEGQREPTIAATHTFLQLIWETCRSHPREPMR